MWPMEMMADGIDNGDTHHRQVGNFEFYFWKRFLKSDFWKLLSIRETEILNFDEFEPNLEQLYTKNSSHTLISRQYTALVSRLTWTQTNSLPVLSHRAQAFHAMVEGSHERERRQQQQRVGFLEIWPTFSIAQDFAVISR